MDNNTIILISIIVIILFIYKDTIFSLLLSNTHLSQLFNLIDNKKINETYSNKTFHNTLHINPANINDLETEYKVVADTYKNDDLFQKESHSDTNTLTNKIAKYDPTQEKPSIINITETAEQKKIDTNFPQRYKEISLEYKKVMDKYAAKEYNDNQFIGKMNNIIPDSKFFSLLHIMHLDSKDGHLNNNNLTCNDNNDLFKYINAYMKFEENKLIIYKELIETINKVKKDKNDHNIHMPMTESNMNNSGQGYSTDINNKFAYNIYPEYRE